MIYLFAKMIYILGVTRIGRPSQDFPLRYHSPLIWRIDTLGRAFNRSLVVTEVQPQFVIHKVLFASHQAISLPKRYNALPSVQVFPLDNLRCSTNAPHTSRLIFLILFNCLFALPVEDIAILGNDLHKTKRDLHIVQHLNHMQIYLK